MVQGNSAQFLSLATQLIVEFMHGEKKRSRFMERRKKDTFIAKQSFQNPFVHPASDKAYQVPRCFASQVVHQPRLRSLV